MRFLARLTSVAALILAAGLVNGCLVLAVGAGAAAAYGVVKYTDNEAYRDFDAPLERTWRGAVAALRDAGYSASGELAGDATEGRIEIDDAKATVTRLPGGVSRVTVRIGSFDSDDHRRRAALILEDVARRVE